MTKQLTNIDRQKARADALLRDMITKRGTERPDTDPERAEAALEVIRRAVAR